ncbi:MAG: hypothetical protein J4O04_07465 [Chloroflexi bacterium]|nr:hypothetical protein [Chloroflexota bacterium]
MTGTPFILISGLRALRMFAMACGNTFPDDLHAARYGRDAGLMMSLRSIH